MNWVRSARELVEKWLGGKVRARAIILLALVLGLGGADLGAVGAMAALLQRTFSITKAEIGMLITASQGAGLVSTMFFGRLVDRAKRIRVLAISVALWTLAMIACGAATSYWFLIIARIAAGLVLAAALPCTASLIGDYFPGEERGKIYGYILSGEMIGTGLGFIVSGEIAELWWRLGFWVLAVFAIPLAWAVSKLPEPQRGGQSRSKAGEAEGKQEGTSAEFEHSERGERLAAKKTKEAGIKPRQQLVLDVDPSRKSVWWAIWYLVRIPTNIVLITSSALGYAFFADARTFGVEYMSTHFKVGHSTALLLLLVLGVGAIAGLPVGGRLGDSLLRRGHVPARVWVSTFFFGTAVVFFGLGNLFSNLWLAMFFFVCSTFSLGAVNPPLDAARLDIIHFHLWGRSESLRMMFRNAAEAIAPLSFGWLVASFGGDHNGLRNAFFLMLIPLAIAGLIGLITFRTYPADVATAAEYSKKTETS